MLFLFGKTRSVINCVSSEKDSTNYMQDGTDYAEHWSEDAAAAMTSHQINADDGPSLHALKEEGVFPVSTRDKEAQVEASEQEAPDPSTIAGLFYYRKSRRRKIKRCLRENLGQVTTSISS